MPMQPKGLRRRPRMQRAWRRSGRSRIAHPRSCFRRSPRLAAALPLPAEERARAARETRPQFGLLLLDLRSQRGGDEVRETLRLGTRLRSTGWRLSGARSRSRKTVQPVERKSAYEGRSSRRDQWTRPTRNTQRRVISTALRRVAQGLISDAELRQPSDGDVGAHPGGEHLRREGARDLLIARRVRNAQRFRSGRLATV